MTANCMQSNYKITWKHLKKQILISNCHLDTASWYSYEIQKMFKLQILDWTKDWISLLFEMLMSKEEADSA